jgi:gamma-glutamyltranspeptidase/glutathione hydrolase
MPLIICGIQTTHQPQFPQSEFVIHTGRKIVMLLFMGSRYMIAAGHPVTAEAAQHAMEQGGNAVDGVLAGWLAAGLTEPVLTSPGGGGFAMISPARGAPRLYDFFSQTPLSPNPDGQTYPLEADFGSTRQTFHLGIGSVATPGCVAGLMKLHDDFGRLPLSECAAPARHLSKNGVTITDHAETLLSVVNDLYRATPEAANLFVSRTDQSKCLLKGELFLNPDYANFLDMLEAEGARWFYEGDAGRIVSDLCRDQGGHLTREDFLNYEVIIRDPLVINRNGATIYLNPPPSMGGTLIGIGLLSGAMASHATYPFSQYKDWANWLNPLRLMSQLRTPGGMKSLTGDDLAGIQRALAESAPLKDAVNDLFPHALDHLHNTGTTQISIVDADGNEVSMTTSNGAGSAIIIPDTGIMLNNMLGEEDLQPDGMNTWKPDRRLASMMAPTLVRFADRRGVATGSGGSNRIRSTILQILRHLIDHQNDLKGAIHAPRLHWEEGTLHAEHGAMEGLACAQESLPWPVVEHKDRNLFFGGAHSVGYEPGGSFIGVGDPRRGGVTAGG